MGDVCGIAGYRQKLKLLQSSDSIRGAATQKEAGTRLRAFLAVGESELEPAVLCGIKGNVCGIAGYRQILADLQSSDSLGKTA